MFKSLHNIQNAFSLVRIFLVLITFISSTVSIYAIYSAYSFAEKQREKIYVLDNGKSLILALSQDINQNRLAESRSHVKRFHEYFFTISPEKEAIEYNIKQALPLADNVAFEKYQTMKEEGFYNRIIASGINCEIRIDSVVVDDSIYPFHCITYGRTAIVRSSNVTYRNLETSCELVNCSRSDKNPHGFIMENWKIVDNSDIKVVQRD